MFGAQSMTACCWKFLLARIFSAYHDTDLTPYHCFKKVGYIRIRQDARLLPFVSIVPVLLNSNKICIMKLYKIILLST